MCAWKYLKPARSVTSPSVVFSIAVQTRVVKGRRSRHYDELFFQRAVACVSRRRRGKWSKPKLHEFLAPELLWDWIESEADKRRRNYVIAANISDVTTLTNWWERVQKREIWFRGVAVRTTGVRSVNTGDDCIMFRRCILRGNPDIIDFAYDDKRYLFLSGRQYLSSSDADIQRSIASRVPNNDLDSRDLFGRLDATERECLQWSVAFCSLSDWWSEHSAAPFGMTVGQLAMGVLRSNVPEKAICTHSDTQAHQLERLACYGGRASCWYVGCVLNSITEIRREDRGLFTDNIPVISGPLTHIDIRSMYPTLLRDSTFPVRLHKRYENISTESLRELMSMYGVIAHVTLWASNAEYPYRLGERVVYPRGYVQTVLAGPELLAIRVPDRLIHVHSASCYLLGTPFQSAASRLLDMRQSARDSSDLAWELFAKTLANSLGGKLAQKKGSYKDLPGYPALQQWGEWIERSVEANTTRKFRAIAGMVSEYLPDSSGEGPYTASFAYLTAYGRQLMRNIREKLGTYAVVSQDTDGLWIAATLLAITESLPGMFGNSPGQLRATQSTRYARFLGPRHYLTEHGWTLAGFHNPIIDPATLRVSDTFAENPLLIGVSDRPQSLFQRQRVSALRNDTVGGEVFPDGWVRPLYLKPPAEFVIP